MLATPSQRVCRWMLVSAVVCAWATVPAAAENPCSSLPSEVVLQPLVQPPELKAVGGELSTTFKVRMETHPCVPFFDGDKWTHKAMALRTYLFPTADEEWTPSTPGPTLRLHRADGSTPGDSLSILLVNDLPALTKPADQCNPTCPADDTTCCPPEGQPCPDSCKRGCAQEVSPECFHGDNVTNLHFHGSHVSPQAPQDYVLLQLAPKGTPEKLLPHHTRAVVTTGQFQYAINPFPNNQAEGTHWYHPHKHGSVSLQVLNGMAGALVIEGPFDDWLNGFYLGELTEKLMVIQQLDDRLNFFEQIPGYSSPALLVNGQASPMVTMRPGEVQRWRLVDATMQGSAQISIGIESGGTKSKLKPKLKQIAQDGVQFAPANYASQPLLEQGMGQLTLSPGNRADLLVKAPDAEGTHLLTFEVVGHLADELRERLDAQREGMLEHLRRLAKDGEGESLAAVDREAVAAIAATATGTPLLSIRVQGEPMEMDFPPDCCWPRLPAFLADVEDGELVRERTLLYSMESVPAQQPNSFFINNKQFNPSCVDETMKIGTAEQWTVANSSRPQHPHHIHTNPYQVVAMNGKSLPQPWIWWDTFGLPRISTTPRDVNAGPIWNNEEARTRCPRVCSDEMATWNGQWTTTESGVMSVCGCLPWGSITTRSRFEDYTGEFVIHCHFLGHEDRGMMIGAQTICPTDQGDMWGKPMPSGGPDDCQMTKPASPACTPQ